MTDGLLTIIVWLGAGFIMLVPLIIRTSCIFNDWFQKRLRQDEHRK